MPSVPETHPKLSRRVGANDRLSQVVRQILSLSAGLALTNCLSGCVTLVATGAATGLVAAHDRRGPATFIDDQTLELQAGRRIAFARGLSSDNHVNVNSYNRILLLSGEAVSEADRQKVLDIAGKLPKVRHIFNEIAVGPASPLASRTADTLITTKVKTGLLGLSGMNITRIKVVTERGVVYLMGLVTRKEGELAAAQTRAVGGVRKVVKLFEYPEYPAGGGPEAAPASQAPAAPANEPPDNRAAI